MKEIILDTETTGLSVKDGHRVVEIGCIELDNLIFTIATILQGIFLYISISEKKLLLLFLVFTIHGLEY